MRFCSFTPEVQVVRYRCFVAIHVLLIKLHAEM